MIQPFPFSHANHAIQYGPYSACNRPIQDRTYGKPHHDRFLSTIDIRPLYPFTWLLSTFTANSRRCQLQRVRVSHSTSRASKLSHDTNHMRCKRFGDVMGFGNGYRLWTPQAPPRIGKMSAYQPTLPILPSFSCCEQNFEKDW
jgi:hypothetical protein